MAIKIKATERLMKLRNTKDGEWMYIMMPEIYGRLNKDKVLKEAAMRSGISRGAIQAAWDACGDVIRAWATEGHSVAIPGLGTMRFSVRSSAVAKVEDVSEKLIVRRRVIFTPSPEIVEELRKTSVSITCYDRTGKEVKHIASKDEGIVEDPEQTEEKPQSNGESAGTDTEGSEGKKDEGKKDEGSTDEHKGSESSSEETPDPIV